MPDLPTGRFVLRAWEAWFPGLSSEQLPEWAQGRLALQDSQEAPALEHLPSNFKRRLSQLSRMILHVGHKLQARGESIPLVFVSRWGEINRQAAISLALLETGEVSPAAFSLSVFNTPVSLLTIAAQNHALATAHYAGDEALVNGLEEALALCHRSEGGEVVLLFADESLPEVYRSLEKPEPPYAFGLRLALEGPGRLTLDWQRHPETLGEPPTHPLMFLRWLLSQDKQPLRLYGAGSSLLVQASPL